MIRHLVIVAASLALFAGEISLSQGQEPKESTEGLDMQAARAKMMSARGSKVAYTKKWDLSGLLKYQPKQKVSGTIRMWGSNYITDGFIGGCLGGGVREISSGAQIVRPQQDDHRRGSPSI